MFQVYQGISCGYGICAGQDVLLALACCEKYYYAPNEWVLLVCYPNFDNIKTGQNWHLFVRLAEFFLAINQSLANIWQACNQPITSQINIGMGGIACVKGFGLL